MACPSSRCNDSNSTDEDVLVQSEEYILFPISSDDEACHAAQFVRFAKQLTGGMRVCHV